MRVRCVSLEYERGPVRRVHGHWLTVGREYTVLEVLATPHGVSFHLVLDTLDLGWVEAEIFEVTDGKPSSRWVCSIRSPGTLELTPPNWIGFDWDNDPAPFARAPDEIPDEVVAREAVAILDEDPTGWPRPGADRVPHAE
jgi:hypothetical protein